MLNKNQLKVEDLNDLKKSASNGQVLIKIILNYGLFSSKWVGYKNGKWTIENCIDGSKQRGLDDLELKTGTNIIKALEKGALYFSI